jgi:hypothetical protein
VIVEHNSTVSPAIGFYHAVKWAKEKGYRVVIDDILDTLYLHTAHLELAGYDVSILKDLEVIKEGGVTKVGNVVGNLRLKEYAIRQAEYKNIYEPLLSGGNVFNIVLGIEKLFLISDTRENMNTVSSILNYTGDKRRIALYFINETLINACQSSLLPLLEEIATTMVKVTKEKSDYVFSVVKSINDELDGMTVRVSPSRVL